MEVIIEKAIPMFVSTALTVYLFYFNVPVWTAREIEELGKNGVWRFVFHLIASIGDIIYKIIETICTTVQELFKLRERSLLISLLNLFLFLGAIYGLQWVHEELVTQVCLVGVEEIHFKNWTSYNLFRDLQIVGALGSNLVDWGADAGFLERLGDTIFNIVLYVALTVCHFAVMFGLLDNKCEDMNLIDRFFGRTHIVYALEYKPRNKGFVETLKKIGSSALDFINDLTMIDNFKVGATPFVFCIMLGVYSVVQVLMGATADFGELLMNLLDETDILNLAFSFVIGFVVCMFGKLIGLFLYRRLPVEMQERLSRISAFWNRRTETLVTSRTEWAKKHGYIRRPREHYDIPKMVLEREE